MMSPIGPFLAEFVPQPAPPRLPAPTFPGSDFLDGDATLAEETEALRLDQARSEGFADGAATAEAAFAAEAAALTSRHDEHLAAERRRWADAQGAALAELLQHGLAELERRLADAAAEILEPFISRSLRVKAVADLRDAVERLLSSSTDAAIRVSGPADIVEPLRVAFEGRTGITVLAAESPEVTVLAGDTVIRSQLRSWACGLKPDVRDEP